MSSNNPLRSAALFLLIGAVFGLILAGSLELTPEIFGSEDSDRPPQTLAAPAAGGAVPSFADLAEAVLPAVVLVQSTTIESTEGRPDPFHFFFRDRMPAPDGEPREFRSDGAGSGFFVSPDGWIVTNNHVIEGATSVTVIRDGHEWEAEVKGADPATDLAVLKIDTDEELPYLALGDSEELRVGDWVMAVGNPLQLTSSVTVGVVSAKGRSIGLTSDVSFENFIQTDAAINRGNSGGPLVNLQGEVVGISTAMNFGAENIGFAVPVDTLRQVLPQLQSEGRVRRGYLGVNIQNVADDTREAFGLESNDGALVTDVREDTPAERAGLRHGDVIVEVDGRQVETTRDLIDYVASRQPGAEVELTIVRNGDREKKTVTLEERDADTQVAEVEPDGREGGLDWLGVEYQGVDEEARRLGIPAGVDGVLITEVQPTSPLYEEGVTPGTVISEVNGEAFDGIDEFEAAVGAIPSGSYLRLYCQRFGRDGARASFFAIVRKP